MYSCSVSWSTSDAWRWLNVPRRVSWPATRTGVPSSSSEPNASASAERPVDLVAVERVAAACEHALELRVQREASGNVVERVDDPLERARAARAVAIDGAGAGSLGARRRDPSACGRSLVVRLVERGVQPRPEVLERVFASLERDVAAVHERLGVELAHRAAVAR